MEAAETYFGGVVMRRTLANQLVEFVEGQITLDDFELWLVRHLQAIIDEGDADLKSYADQLDGLLIQFREQVVSIWELAEAIENVLRNLNTIIELSFTTRQSVSASTADSEDMEVVIRDLGAIQEHHLPVFEVV